VAEAGAGVAEAGAGAAVTGAGAAPPPAAGTGIVGSVRGLAAVLYVATVGQAVAATTGETAAYGAGPGMA